MRSVYSCGIDPKFHHSFVVTFLHLQRMFRRVEKMFHCWLFHGWSWMVCWTPCCNGWWCAESLAAGMGMMTCCYGEVLIGVAKVVLYVSLSQWAYVFFNELMCFVSSWFQWRGVLSSMIGSTTVRCGEGAAHTTRIHVETIGRFFCFLDNQASLCKNKLLHNSMFLNWDYIATMDHFSYWHNCLSTGYGKYVACNVSQNMFYPKGKVIVNQKNIHTHTCISKHCLKIQSQVKHVSVNMLKNNRS